MCLMIHPRLTSAKSVSTVYDMFAMITVLSGSWEQQQFDYCFPWYLHNADLGLSKLSRRVGVGCGGGRSRKYGEDEA